MPHRTNGVGVETTHLMQQPRNGVIPSTYQLSTPNEYRAVETGKSRVEAPKYSLRRAAKAMVFGGFDGLLASITIVAGAAGGQLDFRSTIMLGPAITLASSLSVGVNEYLSSRAHRQYLECARRRETWEFKHFREGEIMQMTSRFMARGMERKDAEGVVAKLAEHDSLFVGLMMADELGYRIPDDENSIEELWTAVLMLLFFALCGCAPYFVVWVVAQTGMHSTDVYICALATSIACLFFISLAKSMLSSAALPHVLAESLMLGCAAAATCYSLASLGTRFWQDWS